MRIIKKRHLAILVLSMAVAGAGIGAAYASTGADNKNNPMSELVQAIANKFNLDENEVQQVFDEQREAMQAEREVKLKQEFAEQLKAAVNDGKLTRTQADLITRKREELQAEREANRGEMKNRATLTEEERKARQEEMIAKMTKLKQWADDNNIPRQYLMMIDDRGGYRGHGKGIGAIGHDCTIEDVNKQ